MSARDELESIITRAVNDGLVGYDVCMPHVEIAVAVDDILAAGYSKPRTISTVEELDALPDGAAVQTSDESDTVVMRDRPIGFRNSSGYEVSIEILWRHGIRPFTVLYTPKES